MPTPPATGGRAPSQAVLGDLRQAASLTGSSGAAGSAGHHVRLLGDGGTTGPVAAAAADLPALLRPSPLPAAAAAAAAGTAPPPPLADGNGASFSQAPSRPEPFPDAITVIVKTMDTRNHAVFCSADATVLELKQAVYLGVNVEPGRQRLIHLGRALKPDHEKISQFGVTDGKAIHLVVREEADGDASEGRASSEHSSGGLTHSYGQDASTGRSLFNAPLQIGTDLSDVFRSMSAGPTVVSSLPPSAAGGPAFSNASGRIPTRTQDHSTLYVTGNGMSSCTLLPRSRGNQFFTRAVPLARLHGPTTETTPQTQMARIRASLRNVDVLLAHLAASTPPELYSIALPAVSDPVRQDMAEFDAATVDQVGALMRLTEEVAQMELRVAEALRASVTTLRPRSIDQCLQHPRERLRTTAIIIGNISYRMSQIHLLLMPLTMNLQFSDGDANGATGIAIPPADLPRRLRPHASTAYAGQPDTLFGSSSSGSASVIRRGRALRAQNGAPSFSGQNGGAGIAPAARPPLAVPNLAGGGPPSSTRSSQPGALASSTNRAGPSLISMELSLGINDRPAAAGSEQPRSAAPAADGDARTQREQSDSTTSTRAASGQQGGGPTGNDSRSHQAVFHFTILPPQLHFVSTTTRGSASASRATSLPAPTDQSPRSSASEPSGSAAIGASTPSPFRTQASSSASTRLDEFQYIPAGLRFGDLRARGGVAGAIPNILADPAMRNHADLQPTNRQSTPRRPGTSEGCASAEPSGAPAVSGASPETPPGVTGADAAAAGRFVGDHPRDRSPHSPTAASHPVSESQQPLEADRVLGPSTSESASSLPGEGDSASGSSRKRRRGGEESDGEAGAGERKRRRH